MRMNRRGLTRLLTSTAPRIFIGFCLFIYVFIPLLVLCFPSIPALLVFLNMVGWPAARWCNFKEPSKEFGLDYSRNFYLDSAPGVTLGVWHIATPSSSLSHTLDGVPYVLFHTLPPPPLSEDSGFDGKPVIFYLHGNSAHRASKHRVELYKLLSSMGYHVVCFDYRGYGDSTGSPSEAGLVHDALTVYKWILERRGDSRVFIWGHSLGTGVACHLGRKIFDIIDGGDAEIRAPDGVVLESPFSNLKEEVREHKFAKPFRMMPYFEHVFIKAFDRVNLHFQSDEHVRHIRAPILFLHADDDHVIPYHLCQRLYESSLKMENGEIRSGEERVQIARGVDKAAVLLALRNVKPHSLSRGLPEAGADEDDASDANENRKSAPDLAAIGARSDHSSDSSENISFRREFVGFTGRAGYRHKWLVRAPELKLVVRDFIGDSVLR